MTSVTLKDRAFSVMVLFAAEADPLAKGTFFAEVFFAAVFLAADFFVAFLAADTVADDFFEAVFFAAVFLAAVFLAVDFFTDFFAALRAGLLSSAAEAVESVSAIDSFEVAELFFLAISFGILPAKPVGPVSRNDDY